MTSKSILSIQSHVVYGYVGNKAAVYPLQSMGYDVWPIYTVQFSNHTGYKTCKGKIFDKEHIKNLVDGLDDIDVLRKCDAVISGYMGSDDICHEVYNTVQRIKEKNPNAIYLCDPVIGNNSCYVKPEVLDFFRDHLSADIITPNQFEAETLSGIQISDENSVKRASEFFHNKNIKIVVITGVITSGNVLCNYASYNGAIHSIPHKQYNFTAMPNGTGDLFSALFLGHYLRDFDSAKALQYSTKKTLSAIERTYEEKSNELMIF